MAKREKTAIVGLTLRLREDLRRRLAAAAEKANHSLNQEVVQRLEASFHVDQAERVLAQAMETLADVQRVRAKATEFMEEGERRHGKAIAMHERILRLTEVEK